MAANEYQLISLQQKCEKKISTFLDAENAAGLLELSDRLSCKQLRTHCLFYLRENLTIVKKTLNIDDYLPTELQTEINQDQARSYKYEIDIAARSKTLFNNLYKRPM